MTLEIQDYDLGVKTLKPKINSDDRGFVTEVFRTDWAEFFDGIIPNLSLIHI